MSLLLGMLLNENLESMPAHCGFMDVILLEFGFRHTKRKFSMSQLLFKLRCRILKVNQRPPLALQPIHKDRDPPPYVYNSFCAIGIKVAVHSLS